MREEMQRQQQSMLHDLTNLRQEAQVVRNEKNTAQYDFL